MSVQDLIKEGKAIIEEKRLKKVAENEAERAKREAEADRVTEFAWACVKESIPESLWKYTGLCSEIEQHTTDQKLIYRIEAPGCSAVSFRIEVERRWLNGVETLKAELMNWREDYQSIGIFEVELYEEKPVWDDGKTIGYNVSSSQEHRCLLNDIAVALAYAHAEFEKLPELNARAETHTRELEAREAARMARSDAEERAAQEELNDLFSDLSSDPIAVHLLKAFLLLQKEREDAEQRINDMGEAMDSDSYRHSEAISRIEKRIADAERRRREAEDEAATARSDAEETERKAKKAIDKAKRGW